MKVKHLIDKLSELDPELEIMRRVDTTGDHDDWGVYYNPIDGRRFKPSVLHIRKIHNLNYQCSENDNPDQQIVVINL